MRGNDSLGKGTATRKWVELLELIFMNSRFVNLPGLSQRFDFGKTS